MLVTNKMDNRITSSWEPGNHKKSHQDGEICRHPCSAQSSQSDDDIFKCEHPITKDKESLQARLMTFLQNWPKHTRATPKEIASAGFFFLGQRDRTKCFYCGGGLQNWSWEDDPFFEHAKWYPNCEFILKLKGIAYVEDIASKFPNIQRPLSFEAQKQREQSQSVSNSTVSASKPSPLQQLTQCRSVSIPTTSTSKPRPHKQMQQCRSVNNPTVAKSTPILVECDEIRETTVAPNLTASTSACNQNRIAEQNEVVKEAKNFGFDPATVEMLFRRKVESTGEEYQSVQQLVTDLQAFEAEEEEKSQSGDVEMLEDFDVQEDGAETFGKTNLCNPLFGNPFAANTPAQPDVVLMPAGPGSRKLVCKKQVDIQPSTTSTNDNCSDHHKLQVNADIDKIKQEQLCKICLDKSSDCVFFDCYHICCCRDCAAALKICPICRAKINKIVLFYRQ